MKVAVIGGGSSYTPELINGFPKLFQFDQMHFPEAERACERESVWLEESVFCAGKRGIDDAVAAISKIQANGPELAARLAELQA